MRKFKPTKNQERMLRDLGPEYHLDIIDNAPCIVRKLNDNCDIEISGTSLPKRHRSLFVWRYFPEEHRREIVEKYFDIPDDQMLKVILHRVVEKYQDRA